jgi:hypothetical protein
MPTPIPTNYALYLDPLLGFTPGGTTWNDQSVYEQVYTFNNTGYTYENTIGSFLLPISPFTLANQDAPLPGEIGVGASAKTIIAWVKVNYATAINGDFFVVYSLGRNSRSGIQESRSIFLRIECIDSGPGGSLVFVPGIFNTLGYRLSSFTVGANTTYWQDSNWHMITMTKPSSGTVSTQKLYVDGIEITAYAGGSTNYLVDTSVNNVPAGLSPRMRINDNTLYTSTMPASLGQLWIYNEVLTQPDLLNFYEQTVDRYYPAPPEPKSNGRSFQQGFNG